MTDPLDDQDEDGGYLRYLFHTTSYEAAEQIKNDGFRPRQGAGVFQHGGYDLHSQGKIFASDGNAALEWFGKVQDQLEHHGSDWGELDERIAAAVPVMLRIDLDDLHEEPKIDELGSRDVIGGTSYYFTKRIKPTALEYWDPKSKTWEPIEDGLPDARLGVDDLEYYDAEGNPIDEEEWDGETPPGISTIGPYDRGGFKPNKPSYRG